MSLPAELFQAELPIHACKWEFFRRKEQFSSTKHTVLPRVSPFPTADVETLVEKNRKRNRRVKHRKKQESVIKELKLLGVNCAGLASKLHSFDKLLSDIQPGIFFLEETKSKHLGKLKTENCKKYQIFEMVRRQGAGGGLAIGALHNLNPTWLGEGDDYVEWLSVEITLQLFRIRCVVAYGPQEADCNDRKEKFWAQLDSETTTAQNQGTGLFTDYTDGWQSVGRASTNPR